MSKKLIEVDAQAFDDLMYWLDRCSEKGHLENCADLVDPWAIFDAKGWRVVEATQPAAGERKPIGYISEAVHQELLNGKHVPANICTATPSRRNPHPGPDANWSVPIFAAPPAAAHGDEAVRKDAERIRQLEVLLDRCRDHVSESMELMDDYDDAEEDAGIAQELLDDIDDAMRAQGDGE